MAYLGNQPIIGDSINKFKILDDISTFTLTFDGSSANTVSVANDTIVAPNHRFITGQKVTYSNGGGTVITGLTDGTSYFIIKVDQNTIQLATSASPSTAIDLTGLGVGASHTLNVKFDGTNTKFKITHNNGIKSTITKPEQLSLSINGVIQNPASDYSVESDSTLAFNTAPVATDKAFGSFIEAVVTFDASDFDEHIIDEFIGDGSTTAFSLSKTPPSSRDIIVVIDGVFQYPHSSGQTRSYSAAGSQLTFIAAPADGAVIQARHIGFAAATSTPAVTAFYGRTGNVTFDSSDDLSINNLTAAGNVSIDGVLTYEDVTNVDSIGIITARDGISITGGNVTLTGGGSFIGDGSTLTGIASTENVNTSSLNVVGIATVGSGITLSPDGDGFFTGITTTRSASFGGGVLQETFHNDTSAVSGTHDHDALTYGMVWNGSTNAGGSFVINLRGDASTTFDSLIDIGKVTTMTIYSANNNASNYMTAFQIDGSAQTIKYSGGSAPSAATGSGVDVYSLTILKTAANTYSIFGNFTNFA